MRLSELSGAKAIINKARSFADPEDFKKYMEMLGFKYMDEGAYGYVFDNVKYNYVVKVVTWDPGYKKFVEFALAHQNNPCLPKMRGQWIKIGTDSFIVRMEKLKEITRAEYMDSGMRSYLKYSISLDDAERLAEEHPDFVNTLIELHKFGGRGIMMDMKGDNVMKRDNTYVIIDPFEAHQNAYS